MERTKAPIISPGAVIAVIEAMTFHFHIYWPSFSTACCVFNQYCSRYFSALQEVLLTKMRNVFCGEGQIGVFFFFFLASFVLIKTLWDYLEGFNVLKDRYTLRVTYTGAPTMVVIVWLGFFFFLFGFTFWLILMNHFITSRKHSAKSVSVGSYFGFTGPVFRDIH